MPLKMTSHRKLSGACRSIPVIGKVFRQLISLPSQMCMGYFWIRSKKAITVGLERSAFHYQILYYLQGWTSAQLRLSSLRRQPMNSRKLAVTCLDHIALHIPIPCQAHSRYGPRIHDTAKPVTEWLSPSALLARLATMLSVLGCLSPNTFLLISITCMNSPSAAFRRPRFQYVDTRLAMLPSVLAPALPLPSIVLDSGTSMRDWRCWSAFKTE